MRRAEPFRLETGLVTLLASDYGLAVCETGDRPFRDGLNHFVLRLVPFLVGHVTGQRPLYDFAVRETGDRPNPDGLNRFVFLPLAT